MPHITVEISSGAETIVDVARLVDAVHQAALATGVFPVAGVRTFARLSPYSRVFDGAADNAFIQISARIAPGRPKEVRQRVARDLLQAAETETAALFERGPAAVQVEITELDPDMTVRRNTALDG